MSPARPFVPSYSHLFRLLNKPGGKFVPHLLFVPRYPCLEPWGGKGTLLSFPLFASTKRMRTGERMQRDLKALLSTMRNGLLRENSCSVDAYHAQIGMGPKLYVLAQPVRILSVWGASFGMRQWLAAASRVLSHPAPRDPGSSVSWLKARCKPLASAMGCGDTITIHVQRGECIIQTHQFVLKK